MAQLFCLLFLFLFPVPAMAGVMDALPSLPMVWGAGVLGAAATILSRKKKWVAAALIFPGFFFASLADRLVDPAIWDAVLREAGVFYLFSIAASIGLIGAALLWYYTQPRNDA